MNDNVKKFYETLFPSLEKTFNEKNIKTKLFGNSKNALEYIFSSIKQGQSVGYGGSTTLEQIGFHGEIRKMDINLFDRIGPGVDKKQKTEYQKKSLTADIFITGVNAISMDGTLFFIDGVGNRVAPIIYGPDKVILVSGVNKICPDRDYAYKRMKFFSCPANSMRLNLNTPCAKTGVDIDCRSDERICSATVIIDFSRIKDRIELVLINEELGF